MPHLLLKPRPNTRVSHSTGPGETRSESDLAVNPANPNQMVGVSKRFPNSATYQYQADVYVSSDGGKTWKEVRVPPYTPPGASKPADLSDPVVHWRPEGVYLAFNAFDEAQNRGVAIILYHSTDAGLSWGAPIVVNTTPHDDDKQAIGSHNSGLALAWDINSTPSGTMLGYARRSGPNGWAGFGRDAAGLGYPGVGDSFSPALGSSLGGFDFIAWLGNSPSHPGRKAIKLLASRDIEDDHWDLPKVIADNIDAYANATLPGARFRVYTIPAISAIGPRGVLVAWAERRNGAARIYYVVTRDGDRWITGPAGEGIPLRPDATDPSEHHIHPRLALMPNGVVACTYYRYRYANGTRRMDVVLDASWDMAATEYWSMANPTFSASAVVTDQPFDPEVGAQAGPGGGSVEFFGDYFGLAASQLGFYPLWTDTRTGAQEIFTAQIQPQTAVPLQS